MFEATHSPSRIRSEKSDSLVWVLWTEQTPHCLVALGLQAFFSLPTPNLLPWHPVSICSSNTTMPQTHWGFQSCCFMRNALYLFHLVSSCSLLPACLGLIHLHSKAFLKVAPGSPSLPPSVLAQSTTQCNHVFPWLVSSPRMSPLSIYCCGILIFYNLYTNENWNRKAEGLTPEAPERRPAQTLIWA